MEEPNRDNENHPDEDDSPDYDPDMMEAILAAWGEEEVEEWLQQYNHLWSTSSNPGPTSTSTSRTTQPRNPQAMRVQTVDLYRVPDATSSEEAEETEETPSFNPGVKPNLPSWLDDLRLDEFELNREDWYAATQFAKQRKRWLDYSQSALKSFIDKFEKPAAALLSDAKKLIARANDGERSDDLIGLLESVLKWAGELREAAQSAYDKDKAFVTRQRAVDSKSFGLEGDVAKRVVERCRRFILPIPALTQQEEISYRNTLQKVDEANRGLRLALRRVQTGKLDPDLVKDYFAVVRASVASLLDKLKSNTKHMNTMLEMFRAIINQRAERESIDGFIAENRELVLSSKEDVEECFKLIKALCLEALRWFGQLTNKKRKPFKDCYEQIHQILFAAPGKVSAFTKKFDEFQKLVNETQK